MKIDPAPWKKGFLVPVSPVELNYKSTSQWQDACGAAELFDVF